MIARTLSPDESSRETNKENIAGPFCADAVQVQVLSAMVEIPENTVVEDIGLKKWCMKSNVERKPHGIEVIFRHLHSPE